MNKIKITSLIISFLWISLGTVIQISAYSTYNYFGFDCNSSFYDFLWWITFPFNILLFGLLFADTLNNIYIFVILLQLIKILIYWWIIYKVCLYIRKNRNKDLHKM